MSFEYGGPGLNGCWRGERKDAGSRDKRREDLRFGRGRKGEESDVGTASGRLEGQIGPKYNSVRLMRGEQHSEATTHSSIIFAIALKAQLKWFGAKS